MSEPSRWNGLILLIFAAILGFWLLLIPGLVFDQYERFQSAGPVWGTIYLVLVGVGATLLFGSTGWIVVKLWLRKRAKRKDKELRAKSPSQMTTEQKESEIEGNLQLVKELESDEAIDVEFKREIDPLLEEFVDKREGSQLEIVAFGSISSGKSALLNLLANRNVFHSDVRGGTTVRRSEIPWPGQDRVTLVDTPGLGEIDAAERLSIAASAAQNADLILLVVDGPLRDHEFELVTELCAMEKQILVCLNKIDWYSKDERTRLQEQIGEQLKGRVAAKDILPVQAQAIQRIRVRIADNGEEVEEAVEEAPDIETLSVRMLDILKRSGKELLLANLLLQSRGLVEMAKERVKERLDRRAWTLVERYMWGAAGAAALSPFPLVDLISGCAISSKMVIDLAKVYRQDVDLDTAVSLLGQLGKNLLGILGASAATPAVSTIFASMLKTVPGIGTIAGGLLQGCVQAIVTRWIGAVFIEYFRNDLHETDQGLTTIARMKWKELTTVSELRKIVSQTKQVFSKKSDD